MPKLKFIKKNLQDILVYTDSEILELFLSFILVTYSWWSLPTVKPFFLRYFLLATGLMMLAGLALKKPSLRLNGLLLTVVNFFVILSMIFSKELFDFYKHFIYFVYLSTFSYAYWKIGRQFRFCKKRD